MNIDIDAQQQLLTVDGVKIHFDVLKALTQPDPNRYYRFTRNGDEAPTVVHAFEIHKGGK